MSTQELVQAIILGAATLDDCGTDEFVVFVETRNGVWVTALIGRANLSQVFPDDGTDEGVEGRTLDESLRRLAASVEKKLVLREDEARLALERLRAATREQP